MYILVEILHTEFQYVSLIEMQKYNWNRKRMRKEKQKNGSFVPVGAPGTWHCQPGQNGVFFVPVARPGRPGVSG